MIRILYRNEHGEVNDQLQMDELVEALEDTSGFVWLDMVMAPSEVVEPLMAQTFGFHPLAIDDALHESHIPKIDDWADYLYIVLRAVNPASVDGNHLQIPELDVFLGPNFVVTYSQETITAVERAWELCQKDQRWINRGAGLFVYRLIDELVSEAVLVVEKLQDDLELIEDNIFAETKPAPLERLFTLKRNILQLRRIVVPQRDVLNKLSRNDYPIIKAADHIFFRDVYDHLLQLDDLLDDLLILVGGALDTYLSVVNNRMNNIMKTLTVITAFFMPLALITSFFGMNFFQAKIAQLESWTSVFAFGIVLLIMIFLPLAMFLWMRRRDWI